MTVRVRGREWWSWSWVRCWRRTRGRISRDCDYDDGDDESGRDDVEGLVQQVGEWVLLLLLSVQ